MLHTSESRQAGSAVGWMASWRRWHISPGLRRSHCPGGERISSKASKGEVEGREGGSRDQATVPEGLCGGYIAKTCSNGGGGWILGALLWGFTVNREWGQHFEVET